MRYPMMGTEKVSKRSNVAATSRMDFAPALTTKTGIEANECRSADSSQVSWAPRCTPPKPPVAKNEMPAALAMCEVAATVVAALNFLALTVAKSLMEAFKMLVSLAIRSKPSESKPTFITPSIMAIVAGVAPFERTISSTPRATSMLVGRGSP